MLPTRACTSMVSGMSTCCCDDLDHNLVANLWIAIQFPIRILAPTPRLFLSAHSHQDLHRMPAMDVDRVRLSKGESRKGSIRVFDGKVQLKL